MQKIATRIFIYSSIIFGVTGILMIITGGLNDGEMSNLTKFLQKYFL